MKSKTLIEKQTKRKTNSKLVETIIAAKKNKEWIKIADILSGPRKRRINLNLEEIDNGVKEGESIVIPGKVLSQGELGKKVKIIALAFSDKAREKLLKSKCDVQDILNEIKKNPDAKGVRIWQK